MATQCSPTIRQTIHQLTVVMFLLQIQRDWFSNCGVCILASEIDVPRIKDNTKDRGSTQVNLTADQCPTTLSVCQGQGTTVKVTATVETDSEPPSSVAFAVSTSQDTKVIEVNTRTRRMIYRRDTGYYDSTRRTIIYKRDTYYDSTRRHRYKRDTGYDSTRRHRYNRDTGYNSNRRTIYKRATRYELSVEVDTYYKKGCKVTTEGIASEIGGDIVRPRPSEATACDKNVTIKISCKYTQGRAERIVSELEGDIVRPPTSSDETACDNNVTINARHCPNNGDSKDAKCLGTTQPPPGEITTVKPTLRTTTVRQTQNTPRQLREGSSIPRQNTSSSTPHQTKAPEKDDEKKMIYILAGSGVGVGVLLGFLILCCCKRRRCCNRKPTPAADQPTATATPIQKAPEDVTPGHLMVLTPDMKSYYRVPSNHVPPGFLFVPSMDDIGFRLLPETDVPPGKRVVPQRDPPGYIIVPAPPGTGNLLAPKNYKPAKLAEEKAASVISSDSGSEDNLDVSSIISSALCNVDLESCDSLGSADSKDSKAGSVISNKSSDSRSDSDKSSDTKSVELSPPKSTV